MPSLHHMFSRINQEFLQNFLIMPSTMCSELISENEHILTEILIRIPAKIAVKFKSVSKLWHSLISSTYFSTLHFNHHNSTDLNSISGIFFRRRSVPSPYSYQYLSVDTAVILSASAFGFPGFVISILQSCNGLLLYYSLNESDSSVLNLNVYNPTTGRLRTLPSIQNSFVSAALAFDPRRLSYKVIAVHTTLYSRCYDFKIYSSQTNCWRDLDVKDFEFSYDMEFRNGVFWRGAVHWVCRSEYSVYFEVDKERVAKMPSPFVSTSERGYSKCFECKGKLCYLWSEQYNMIVKVHMLESYEEGWFLKFTLDLRLIMMRDSLFSGMNISELSVLSVISGVRCNGGDKYMMIIHVPGKILSYDFEDDSCKEICKIPLEIEGEGHGKKQFYWFDAYPYSYSLAQV